MISFLRTLFFSAVLPSRKAVDSPILSVRDIDALGVELADIFATKSLKLLANPRASESIKQGEQASHYLGSGMEYDESRVYQQGDEVRRINWRLMARTGKAYTKLFLEERQESWTIILDKRQSMRFGTRKQLKVQQAIKAMGFFAWQAEKLGLPVELICMNKEVKTSPMYEGKGAFESLIARANMPCPPLQVVGEPSLNDELLACQRRLQAGSRLMVVSDFHDLDDRTISLLVSLQQKVMVSVVLIFDAVEKNLPNLSGLKLQTMNGVEIADLSANQRQDYNQWAEHYFVNLTTKLASIGVVVRELSTTDNLIKLTEQYTQ